MRSFRWHPALVVALLAAGVVTACETVPYTGRSQLQFMSPLLGAGATVGVLLPWSRAQESEADQPGLIMMLKAGYDPHAARDLWVRMAAVSRRGRGSPPEFLSTHPSEPTRIQQIEVWMPEAMQYYRTR